MSDAISNFLMATTSPSTIVSPVLLTPTSPGIPILPPKNTPFIPLTYSTNEKDTTTSLLYPSSTVNPVLLLSESPLNTPSYLPTITMDQVLDKPIISYYENLNADPKIHARLIKYYYYKTLDKWLYGDLSNILNYFTISNGNVGLIKNLSDYKITNADKYDKKQKHDIIKFIEKKIFRKSDIAVILFKFVKETGTKWVDLYKNEFFLKQVIEKKMTKFIRRMIEK